MAYVLINLVKEKGICKMIDEMKPVKMKYFVITSGMMWEHGDYPSLIIKAVNLESAISKSFSKLEYMDTEHFDDFKKTLLNGDSYYHSSDFFYTIHEMNDDDIIN